MKLVLASLSHETNSFSPIPTPLESFNGGAGPAYGTAARESFRRTGTAIGGMIEAAEAAGAEIDTPVIARCPPSGPVDDHAYAVMTEAIAAAVARGCDAVLLDLHGAMITRSLDDGEGFLLERLRQIAPDIPIGVALDFHANVTARMVENATLCAGYKTYPHLDMRETGALVANLIFRTLGGTITPVMEWGNAPMLPHTLRMDTGEEPMADLIALARRLETTPVLAASIFGGFPLADTHDAGLSAVIVADRRTDAAQAARDRLLAAAWARRADFVYTAEPLDRSLARAKAVPRGPLLLIDHADNCNSGGTLDSMTVVEAAMRHGLDDLAAAPICDPEAAAALHRAGIGATVTIDLGGKIATPAMASKSTPLRLTGQVGARSDGKLLVEGPVYTGTVMNMGPSARLDCGGAQLVVTSRRIEPYDLGVFRALGIEPMRKRFLLLKSRIQYKPAFLPIAAAAIECNGSGVASSDYGLFRFTRLRRPIYPLDADADRVVGF